VTVTRRSARPSPRPQPREVDVEFVELVDEWTREEHAPVDTEEVDDVTTPEPGPKKADAPSRTSIGVVGVLAFIFVFGALLGLAAFHSVLVQNQLQLDRLSRDLQREQARYQELRIQYGQAAAPYRILAQASARGMLQSKSKQPLQSVLPEQGNLHAPSARPFGNVSNFVPPVVSAPPTTAPAQTPPPQTTAPTTTAPAAAPTTTTTLPPASTAPAAPTTTGAAR
jgi:hypothetical protein